MKFFLSLLIVSTTAISADLPKCNLAGISNEKNFTDTIKFPESTIFYQEIKNHSKSMNTQSTKKKDEALVNIELEITSEIESVSPDKDFSYTANFLSPSFKYSKNEDYSVYAKFKSTDNEIYKIISFGKYFHVVDSKGLICNSVGNSGPNDEHLSFIIYQYKSSNPNTIFTSKMSPDKKFNIGLRIIFLGVEAGAINFQEVWTKDGKILLSKKHSFDQFSSTINIAENPINIKNVSADSITYDVNLKPKIIISSSKFYHLEDIKNKN